MLLENLRTQVLDTALLLPKYGLVWMAGGTVCGRDPETGYVVVTPSGMDYERLSPEDMIVTDMDMNLVEGKYRPSVALNLWTAFMRARLDEIYAVVHTHSPYATAFSVLHESIPVITETMADWFGQPIPVTRYLSVEDPEFASLPVQIMGEGYAVLLGNHGPITAGRTLAHALERAVTLEEAAHTYSIAKNVGVPKELTNDQARASFDYYHHRYGQKTTKENCLMEFNEALIAFDLEAENAKEVIDILAGKLHAQNLISAEYGAQTWARELTHPTGLPTKPFCIAFPHADANGVNQSALAVAVLREPVKFRNMADPDSELDVKIVFMLANRNPEDQVQTLRNLAVLFGQPEKLIELRDQSSLQSVASWLRRELRLDQDGSGSSGLEKESGSTSLEKEGGSTGLEKEGGP